MADFSDVHSDETDTRRPRSPRRWLQFGFSTLLKLVALAAVLSAWWADRERLTERIGKLENDQSVLRIALADDVEGVAPPFPAPAYAANVWTGSVPPPTVPQPSPYGATAAAGYRVARDPYPSTPWSPDCDLFDFLNEHKDWLKAHFAEDRGWQDFLAKGRPPVPAPSNLQAPSASADPFLAPRVVAPTPPETAGPQAPESAVAPLAPTGRLREPLEAPAAQAADPPSQSAPLAEPPPSPLAQAAAAKQCLPAILKLLAGGSTKAKAVAARWLATTASSAATSAPALADAANDPDPAVREEALSALAALGPSARSAAPRLAALLRDGDARSDLLQLVNVLLRIDPQADVVPQLIESLGGRDLEKRFLALQILSELGPERGAAAASTVAELLADEDARMRMEGAAVYSRLAVPREAIPVLRDALANEKNRAVKRTIAQAIMRLQNGPQ